MKIPTAFKHRITPQSTELGERLARLAEPSIARLVAEGEPDERCPTCAYRAGTIPNRCADTIMDAMKCSFEGLPFLCHHHRDANGKAHVPCHGWYASRVGRAGKEDIKAFWPLSDKYTEAK
jgi:hypothetical protein